jgi:hypothetical protein
VRDRPFLYNDTVSEPKDPKRRAIISETLPAPTPTPMPNAAGGDSERFVVGVRLGERYVVRGCIGEGGMGTVYLALDEALGTEVALKVVRRDRAAGGTDGLEVLRDEVRLAQRVTHPNVCRTYDLEQLDGRWLIKMEYVHGETLSERLGAGGRLAPAEAIAVARGVIAGLAAAHAIGVVHRDLKPQNIMIEERTQRIVLMDFGIAHAEGTAADGLAGTPEYMAPEQVHGGAVDGRADQYALGCVLYRMLVGEVPFRAPTRLAIAERKIHDAPPDPARTRPELPRWLAAVVLRLLEKDPARRFSSLGELERALAGPAAPAPPRLARAAVILATIAAAALAFVGALFFGVRARAPEWRPKIREHAPAYEENSDAADLSPDGTRVAYPSDRDGTWRIYVGALAGGPSQPVTPREPARLNFPRWTRDGGALLYRSRKNGVYVVERVDLGDGAVVRVADGASEADDCGGGRLVIARVDAPDCAECGRLVVRERDGRERELYRTAPGDRVRWVRCDRAGRRVVFGRVTASATFQNRAAIYLADLAGGTARQLVDDSAQNEYPFVHPDGNSVLFSSARGGGENIWELGLADGTLRQITSGNVDCAPIVTPDGKTLLYNSDTTSLPIFAYGADGGRRQITHTLADFEWPVASADGRELVSAARQAGVTDVRVIALADGVERSLGAGDTPALSADDASVWLSVRDGDGARVFVVPRGGGERRQVARLPGVVRRLVRGGDGAMHASITRKNGAEAWRIADGVPAREAPAPYALVVPAPTGGWRFAERVRGAVTEVELLAPGAQLGAPTNRRLRVRGAVWDDDGRALVAWDGSALVRARVDGGVEPLRKTVDFAGLAVSSDGQTVYGAEVVGHVRRELVLNFAERPRR